MTQEANVKIRKIGLNLEGSMSAPVTLRVTPRYDATFQEDGTAIVPRIIAQILLGPGHRGEYELVKEKTPDPVKEQAVQTEEKTPVQTPKVVKAKKQPAPSNEEIDETKAFAKSIVE